MKNIISFIINLPVVYKPKTILFKNEMKKLKTKLKTYDNIYIDDTDGQTTVIKSITPAEKEFFELSTNTALHQHILNPIKIVDKEAYYPFVEGGDITGKPKEIWIKSVQAIASINSVSLPPVCKYIPRDSTKKYLEKIESTELLTEQNGIHINSEGFTFMKKVLANINLTESFTHDDMIALNILTSKDGVKIIDWEHIKISFYENDIGRFLSDLHWENPSSNKFYYPNEWHDDLLKTYLDERLDANPNINTEQILERIKFAKMWNYLGPIYSILKKSDKLKSDWFLANLEAFNLLSS